MPWVALPFDSSTLSQALSKKFGVRGIPALFILDAATGEVKDQDGRSTISGARGDTGKVLPKWK